MLLRQVKFPVIIGLPILFLMGVFNALAVPTLPTTQPPPRPYLVKDINLVTDSSLSSQPVNLDGTLFFVADNGSGSQALWRSDGTSAGTTLFKDPYPEEGTWRIFHLTSVNGKLFFIANSEADRGHDQLWTSDGTVEGTVPLTEGNTLAFGSVTAFKNRGDVIFFFIFTCSEYFTCNWTLWRSDGTVEGTNKIYEGNGYMEPDGLIELDGTLFFFASDNSAGTGLWRSDGTAEGTSLVKELDYPYWIEIVKMEDIFFFQANNAQNDTVKELWKSDGTPDGTVQVIPANTASNPKYLRNVNGLLFFVATDSEGKVGLWKSDGTAAGTAWIKEIDPGIILNNWSGVNDLLFFRAVDAQHGEELWRSDGTEAGTYMLKDINPGSQSSTPFFFLGRGIGKSLYFIANDGVHGYELWKSDGSEDGTRLVKDIRLGSRGANPGYFTNVNNTLFFGANDGIHSFELWKSDGTEANTVLVKDINTHTMSAFPSNFPNLISFDNKLFFNADDGSGDDPFEINNKTLWVSDGTNAGTEQFLPANVLTRPGDFTIVGDTLFFRAGATLWQSDGTITETTLVKKDIVPYALTAVNDSLFFVFDDYVYGHELWKSDGTMTGTVMVKDIYPDSSSRPRDLTDVEGTLFFTAEDGSHGRELWKSDGTVTGTLLVKDINPGDLNSNPEYLTNMNGTLFFAAATEESGLGLWKSDGTVTGTLLVKDISPEFLTNVNGTLFFAGYDESVGTELWRSDGTEAGTVLLKDILPEDTSYWCSGPEELVNVNNTLFFRAHRDCNKVDELWKSDGTEAGTVHVKTIDSGDDFSYLFHLTNVNGVLFFTARDGYGEEVWQSDGTTAGTIRISDIHPGSGGSSPQHFTYVDNKLFFVADDGTRGRELWAFNLDAHYNFLTFIVKK